MPTLAPSEENGKKIPIAMTAAVTSSTGGEAVLWMNGILCVRIMCTISVCDSRLSMNQPDWNSDWCFGAEHEPHEAVGRDIENRADRTNPNHKPRDIAGVPFARPLQIFLVHAVPRDRHLGEMIKQIQNHQMQRHHRQERQEGARHPHAEQVSEVRAGRTFYFFYDVGQVP